MREDDLEQAVLGTKKSKAGRRYAGLMFSVAVHFVVLVALSLIGLAIPSVPPPAISALLDKTVPASDLLVAAEPLVPQPAESETKMNEGGQSAAPTASVVTSVSAPQMSSQPLSSAISQWADLDVSEEVDLLGKAIGQISAKGIGSGDGDGHGDGAGAFFNIRPVGKKFVYVLDCSRSMNHPHDSEWKTRFKRMKGELARSVVTMDPDMQFFIVFFNDYAIPMPTSGLVAAFPEAKRNILTWTTKIKAGGNTKPIEAMKLAMRLRPDVIYLLTDGAFIHRDEQELLKLPRGHTVIQTYAFKEHLTQEMRAAYELMNQEENVKARRILSKEDFRKTRSVWQSHHFLQKLADKHKGQFRIIP